MKVQAYIFLLVTLIHSIKSEMIVFLCCPNIIATTVTASS